MFSLDSVFKMFGPAMGKLYDEAVEGKYKIVLKPVEGTGEVQIIRVFNDKTRTPIIDNTIKVK